MRQEMTHTIPKPVQTAEIMGRQTNAKIPGTLSDLWWPDPQDAQPGTLVPLEAAILYGLAQGKTYEEIGRDVYLHRDHVKRYIHRKAGPLRKLNANTALHGVLLAIDQGLIPMPPRTPEELAKYDILYRRPKELLEVLSQENGKDSTGKLIAGKLGISEETVKNHLTKIYQITETQSKISALIGYIQWKKAKETAPR